MPRHHHPLLAAVFGIMMIVFGLSIAAIAGSILFVLVAMSGNAVFPADCAITFGSAVFQGRYAGPGIERRIETAATLYAEGKVKKLILAGGKGQGNALSEAEVMREEAIGRGVAEEDIWLERSSVSTWENIAFSKPLFTNCTTIIGISDRYHLSRIRFLAWLQDVDMTVYPADNRATILFEVQSILREAFGNLYYLYRAGEEYVRPRVHLSYHFLHLSSPV